MKKICWIVGIVLLFGSTFTQNGMAEDQIFERALTRAGQEHVPGEIIVKFKPGTPGDVMANLNSRHGASVLYTSPFAGFKRLRIPRGRTLAQMVEIYKRNPNVEYAELNYIAHAHMVPNDPIYFYQWHMDDTWKWTGKVDDPYRELVDGTNPDGGDNGGGINVEPAWDISTGSGVIVAVIDTGVAYEDYEEFVDNPGRGRDYWITYQLAPDLANTSFVAGWDFVNDDDRPNDDEGHGTHVTGTIAQSTNNGIGVAGVSFNCSIMPVKVLDSGGSGTYADIADGIYYAADNGAKVINMSLGGSSGSITLENAVAYAYGEGVTIVCSSGNDGSATTVGYPAAYDAYCIAVGATRYDEAVAYYSNGGASLDMTAPGGDLNVDQNGDGYGDGVLQQTFGSNPTDWGYWFYHGTSMAAPHVVGVAALLIADGVATTPDEVREALQSTAEDKGAAGWDSAYGWGIVDAYAALNWTAGPVDNPPTVSITAPADGATVSGIVTISADATDDMGVTEVEFFVDGSSIGVGTDGLDGWSASWDTTTVADGPHTVTATATDTIEQTGSDSITVTVDNVDDPPTVAITNPEDGSTVSGTLAVTANASDDDAVTQVEFFVDGSSIGVDTDDSDGWSASWDTTTVADGPHTVTATATDTIEQTGSDSIAVTVNNTTAATMHVAGIDMELSHRTAGRNTFTKALATVTIKDASGNVAGATVYGTWSGATSDTDSGVTDSFGEVTLSSDGVKNASGGTIFTFTVTDVSKSGWTYDGVEVTASITVP